MKTRVRGFISHSSKDAWVARQVAAHIAGAGAEVFLDEADISFGEDFEAKILQALTDCGEFLVLLTPWSMKRPYVWMEIGVAWTLKKKIIGVLHGITAAELAGQEGTPVLLKRAKLLDINDLDKFAEKGSSLDLTQLITQMGSA